MRLAVVGTRTFAGEDVLTSYLDRYRARHGELVIISGGARGADRMAADYARRHGLELVVFRPDWVANGRRAGALRNRRIVDAADALVAFWDEASLGTRISLDMAVAKRIPATVVTPDGVEYTYRREDG
jgi:hypothetical protein